MIVTPVFYLLFSKTTYSGSQSSRSDSRFCETFSARSLKILRSWNMTGGFPASLLVVVSFCAARENNFRNMGRERDSDFSEVLGRPICELRGLSLRHCSVKNSCFQQFLSMFYKSSHIEICIFLTDFLSNQLVLCRCDLIYRLW